MIDKLTLTVPKVAIERGKRAARERHTSLSALVTAFLNSLDCQSSAAPKGMDKWVQDLYGAYRMSKDFNEGDLRFQSLLKKHVE